jgi:hypothetical protein
VKEQEILALMNVNSHYGKTIATVTLTVAIVLPIESLPAA